MVALRIQLLRFSFRRTAMIKCGSVKDDGPGIPVEKQKNVFDPFFTTKEVGKGTGLGLSVSYNIIEKMGGTIRLKSQVGKGTTFTVAIPVVAPERK